MKSWLGRGALLAGAGLSLSLPAWYYARNIEPYWLHVSHPHLKVTGIAGVSPVWKGFKIAYLSDLHLGRTAPAHPVMWHAIGRTIAEQPDLVALGGDYFTRGVWNPVLGELIRPLVKAGLPVVAVMGNHDYFGRRGDHLRIRQNLEAEGVRVLVNDAYRLERKGATAWLVGVDDKVKGEPDLQQMCSTLPKGEKPLILLSHNPDLIADLPPNFAHITLSGHTHGGQVNFAPPPFHRQLNWIRFSRTSHRTDYPSGWYMPNGNRLYVGRGLGMSGLQLRFNARPELVMLSLV